MNLDDVIRQYKDRKITKKEFDIKVQEISNTPKDIMTQRPQEQNQIDFTEAKELLKNIRERSRKIKKL
jgi:hypothetical protein